VPVRAPFIDRSAFYHQCANLLVGRRVALEVVQTHRGKQVVVDWKAVSNGAVVGEAVA
jgi:hypothetical protein